MVATEALSASVWTGQLDGLSWLNVSDNQVRHCLPGRRQGKVVYSSNAAPHDLAPERYITVWLSISQDPVFAGMVTFHLHAFAP